MKSNWKERLIDAALLLFMVNAVSVLSVIGYLLNLRILGTIWIVVSISVLILLITSWRLPAVKVAPTENQNTNKEYERPFNNLYKKISAYIGLRKNPSIDKSGVIPRNIKNTEDIKEPSNTANNHSFHTDTLPQPKSEDNQNGKLPDD